MYFSLCENCISLYVWFVFLIFRSNFFIWELFGLELVCCLPVSFLPSKSDWLEGQPFTKRLKHPTTFYRVFTTPDIGNTNTNQIDYCVYTTPDEKIWNRQVGALRALTASWSGGPSLRASWLLPLRLQHSGRVPPRLPLILQASALNRVEPTNQQGHQTNEVH